LLLKTYRGHDLSRFFGRLHGRTSFQINGWDNTSGRQIGHNYGDTCIREAEADIQAGRIQQATGQTLVE